MFPLTALVEDTENTKMNLLSSFIIEKFQKEKSANFTIECDVILKFQDRYAESCDSTSMLVSLLLWQNT